MLELKTPSRSTFSISGAKISSFTIPMSIFRDVSCKPQTILRFALALKIVKPKPKMLNNKPYQFQGAITVN